LLAVLVLGAQQVEALATTAELELKGLDARLASDAALLDPRLASLERALVDAVAIGHASKLEQRNNSLHLLGGSNINATSHTSSAVTVSSQGPG
jgi:hypothetical protein